MPTIIYADGSCIGNPGPGGYAAIIIAPDGTQREIVGSSTHATNNQMELTAALKALEEFHEPIEIEIRSDSEYLVKGMTEWMPGWKEKKWKNSKNKPVENLILWRHLDELALRHRVRWVWVRGHDGDPMNERAHQLARAAAEGEAARLAGAAAE